MPATTTERTRLSTEERREQLLLFGRTHFAEHPFDSISMKEIAEAAGVSKGLLYHYFGGRRGFYLATVEHVINGVLDAMVPGPAETFEAELAMMVLGFVTYCEANADIYKALVRGGLGADSEVGAELDRVRQHALQRVLDAAGVTAPDPTLRILVVGWISFVEASTAEWLDEPSVDRAEFVELLLTTLMPALDQLLPGRES